MNISGVGSIAGLGKIVVFSNTHCWILGSLDSNYIIALSYRDTTNGLYRPSQDLQINSVQARFQNKRSLDIDYYCQSFHLTLPIKHVKINTGCINCYFY